VSQGLSFQWRPAFARTGRTLPLEDKERHGLLPLENHRGELPSVRDLGYCIGDWPQYARIQERDLYAHFSKGGPRNGQACGFAWLGALWAWRNVPEGPLWNVWRSRIRHLPGEVAKKCPLQKVVGGSRPGAPMECNHYIRRTRGNVSAAAPASAVRARPLAPRAMPTPNSDASAPIWSWPSGASPIATTQAPPARPRSRSGTLSCIRLCESRSETAPSAFTAISTTTTPAKPTTRGATPSVITLAPKASSTARNKVPLPRTAPRAPTATR